MWVNIYITPWCEQPNIGGVKPKKGSVSGVPPMGESPILAKLRSFLNVAPTFMARFPNSWMRKHNGKARIIQ